MSELSHVKDVIDLYSKRQNMERDVRDLTVKIDAGVKAMTDSQLRAYESLKALVDPKPSEEKKENGKDVSPYHS